MTYQEKQELMTNVKKQLLDAANWLVIAAHQCDGVTVPKPLITSTTIAATEDSIRRATNQLEIVEENMCQLDTPNSRRILKPMELKSLCPRYEDICTSMSFVE